MPEDLLADLKREARARRVSKSALVRESLEATLRHRSGDGATSCYDPVRLSEIHAAAQVLTLDSDVRLYRRHGNKVIPPADA